MIERDNTQTLCVLILLFAAGILVWFFLDHMAGKPASSSKSDMLEHSKEINVKLPQCGQALRTCTIEVSKRTKSCRKHEAQREILENLRNPFSHKSCATAESELRLDCSTKCQLDYGSLITIAGKPDYEFDPTQDESGRCLIAAKRSITIKGSCIPKPSATKRNKR